MSKILTKYFSIRSDVMFDSSLDRLLESPDMSSRVLGRTEETEQDLYIRSHSMRNTLCFCHHYRCSSIVSLDFERMSCPSFVST